MGRHVAVRGSFTIASSIACSARIPLAIATSGGYSVPEIIEIVLECLSWELGRMNRHIRLLIGKQFCGWGRAADLISFQIGDERIVADRRGHPKTVGEFALHNLNILGGLREMKI